MKKASKTNRAVLVVTLTTLLCLLMVAAKISATQTRNQAPSRTPLPAAKRDLVRQSANAVGLIAVRNSTDATTPRPRGSAVFISKDGLVATNFCSSIHFTVAVCMRPPSPRIAAAEASIDPRAPLHFSVVANSLITVPWSFKNWSTGFPSACTAKTMRTLPAPSRSLRPTEPSGDRPKASLCTSWR